MTAADRQHLAAILGMLGSVHAGERAAAGLQAEAFRRKHRMTWQELLAVQPEKPAPLPDMPPPPEPFYTEPPSPQPASTVRTTDWRAIGGIVAAYGYTVLALCIIFGFGWLVR